VPVIVQRVIQQLTATINKQTRILSVFCE